MTKGRDPFGQFFVSRFFLWKDMLQVRYRKIILIGCSQFKDEKMKFFIVADKNGRSLKSLRQNTNLDTVNTL